MGPLPRKSLQKMSLLLLLAFSSGAPPYGPPGQFLSRVRPVIGSKVFDVTSSQYGAVGDNRTDDTKALQCALDDCAKSGDGGVVLLPGKASNTEADGLVFLSYPLFLDDATGCAIVLAPRATLFAKAWTGPAPPVAPTPRSAAARQRRVDLLRHGSTTQAGESLSTHVSFLNIDNCHSCAIGGGGTIDGNGPAWWFNRSAPRPKLIDIDHSRDFALWNFTATDGGDHTIELGADDVEVAHMEIVMNWVKARPPPGRLGGIMAPNTDGIDIHGTPFYVHHTHIDVGDDNIAVHASDVLVEDCHFGGDAVGHGEPHGHGASIGSVGGGTKLQNISFRRIVFENTHVGPNIKIHGDATDGYVRDVVYEDLVITNAALENLLIHTDYGDEGQLAAPTPPTSGDSSSAFVVSNVLYKNITARGTSKQGGFSCSEKVRCENITMIDVHTDGKPESYVCNYTTGSAKDVTPPIPCLHSDS